MNKMAIGIVAIFMVLTLISCDSNDIGIITTTPDRTMTDELEMACSFMLPLVFHSEEDFYLYAMESESDLSKYATIPSPFDEFEQPEVFWREEVTGRNSLKAFIQFDELIPQAETDKIAIKKVWIDNNLPGTFSYIADNGIEIEISYNKDFSKQKLSEDEHYKVSHYNFSDAKKFLDQSITILQHIDGEEVLYCTRNGVFNQVRMKADNIIITIIVQGRESDSETVKNIFNDDAYKPITVFFTEGEERDEAYRKLIAAVREKTVYNEKQP